MADINKIQISLNIFFSFYRQYSAYHNTNPVQKLVLVPGFSLQPIVVARNPTLVFPIKYSSSSTTRSINDW
jgi:hypothetical protein